MMKFTAHRDSCVDYDGTEIPEYNSTFETPLWPTFGRNSYCFVVYKGLFGKYKIRECIVYGIWYTNIWGYKMDNGWCIIGDELGKTLFTKDELQKAIEICEEKNRMRKVKVKYI